MLTSRNNSDTGIYIVCSDEGLLDRINSMLRGKGVIGVSDAEGKFHYFVDGRKNHAKAVAHINDIVTHNATDYSDVLPENLLSSVLKSTLVFYDFDLALMGTKAIYEIIRRMILFQEDYYDGVRDLYTIANESLKLSYEQTERDIRYAVRKSSFYRSGIKTMQMMRMIADDVADRIREIKRQPV